jgi:peptide/nickel transport system substrate-binding protein
VKIVDPDQIEANYLRPRNFDLLVISQNVGDGTDWYSLWDSSQASSPGLNLSGISDKSLDKFVEQARRINDPKARAERIKQAAKVVDGQIPAVYLYRPDNIALFSDKIHGIDQNKIINSIDYLDSITHWYVNTVSQ